MKKDLSFSIIGIVLCVLVLIASISILIGAFQNTGNADPSGDIMQVSPTTPSTADPVSTPTATVPVPTTEVSPTQQTTVPATQPAVAPTPTDPTEMSPSSPEESISPTVPETTPVPTQPSQPSVAEPSATSPSQATTPEPPDDSGIIASGDWDFGPIKWRITSDGVLTIYDGHRHMQEKQEYIWKDYSDMITKIVIGDGILSIPKNAFSNMPNVTEVVLGNSIEFIDVNAFSNCTSLQSLTLPASLEEIRSYAFYGCSSLETIHFSPDGKLASIERSAFAQTNLTEFLAPSSLRTISYSAFEDCHALQTVTLEGGVERVDAHAFRNCTGLKHIVLGESVDSLGGGVFDNCSAVQHLELYSLRMTGFHGPNLTTVIAGYQTGRAGSFSECTSLTDITYLHPYTDIQSYSFSECSSLTEFIIPDGVTHIGVRAFHETGLTQLIIPASVQEIDMFAFQDSALQKVIFCGDAPIFYNRSCFAGTTVEVYYPDDNSTWAEVIQKEFTGTVTWIPY